MNGTEIPRCIFVCVKLRKGSKASCAGRGARELLAFLRERANGGASRDLVQIRPCGCLDHCKQGPAAIAVTGKAATGKKPPSKHSTKTKRKFRKLRTDLNNNGAERLLKEARNWKPKD